MVRKDFLNKIKSGEITLNIPKVQSFSRVGNGICSFGIVNSNGNGKRLSFSKALSAKLELEDKILILPLPDGGVLLLSKEPLHEAATEGKLSGQDKKLCYSAGIVQMLVGAFELDFSKHTSKSFSDVRFEEHDGVNYAVVTLVTSTTEEDGDR